MAYSEEDGCFIGELEGINDVIVFHGYSVAAFHAIFEESVDDYLLGCEEFNRQPQKPVVENVKKQAIAAG